MVTKCLNKVKWAFFEGDPNYRMYLYNINQILVRMTSERGHGYEMILTFTTIFIWNWLKCNVIASLECCKCTFNCGWFRSYFPIKSETFLTLTFHFRSEVETFSVFHLFFSTLGHFSSLISLWLRVESA